MPQTLDLTPRHTPVQLDSSIFFQRKSGTLKSGLGAALSMLATVMLCQAGFTHAINQDWPFLALVPNSNLLLVAGETIDTTAAPSLLQQGTRREADFNATFAQYYVQLKDDADVSKLHEVRVLFLTSVFSWHAYFVGKPCLSDVLLLWFAGNRRRLQSICAQQRIHRLGLGRHSA